jgi:ABC-type Mn2+/Zn2+ transport system permease subunit
MLVWQKRAYFADGLAHSALLATSISSATGISALFTAPFIAVVFGVLVLNVRSRASNDMTINVISNVMLALGLVIASVTQSNANLSGLLLGDILSTSIDDVLYLSILLIITIIFVFKHLSEIVLISINKDLAIVRGVNVKKMEMIFFVLLSLVLAFSMKMIGMLLVGALAVIPQYTALRISSNPLQMIFYSAMLSSIACVLGMTISYYFDVVTTPMIVVCTGALYILFEAVLYIKSRLS